MNKLAFVFACLLSMMALVSAEWLNMQVKFGHKRLCGGIANYVDLDTYCTECILLWEKPGTVTLRGQDYKMANACCGAVSNRTLSEWK
ncbi:hypothetical protein BC940DRAFT_307820 [Gongronella butleri]|nr:hypothetical protein BC940DRAFT_307820 [Gongronella butleri]